jgi:hypothetical protein
MRGERVAHAVLGWHGLAGDRRLGLRRLGVPVGFPWLTASRLPDLVRFTPERLEPAEGDLPSHVRTPEGEALALYGPELTAEIGRRHGAAVEVMHLDRGIFDEAPVSLITRATVAALAACIGHAPDLRRFRPNLELTTLRAQPFEEDDWVGARVSFGDPETAAVWITQRDVRCAMVNLDPDSAHSDPEVLRSIVRDRDNQAGVYAAVARPGRIEVAQPVFLERVGAPHH